MKKNTLFFLLAPFFALAQVGINRPNNVVGVFHIDGARDNTSATPTTAQQQNDVMVDSQGNLGIGTTSPANKVEIVGNTSNTSGLKFTQATSSSAITTNDNVSGLGVDALGNVVPTNRPFFASVNSTVINSSSAFLTSSTLPFVLLNVATNTPTKIPLDSSSGTLIDSFSINVPSDGKGVMINFMIGLDSYGYQSGTCTVGCNNNPSPRDIFQARLYIDGVAQNVFQNVEMNKGTAGSTDSNLQFNFSTLQTLNTGSHTIDVRISKVNSSTTSTNGIVRFQTISASINATYIK